MGDVSSTPLLVAGTAEAASGVGRAAHTLQRLSRGLKGASPAMAPLVGVGSVGLLYESGKTIKDNLPAFRRRKRLDRLADAVHTAAWGLQGATTAVGAAVRHGAASGLAAAGRGLGLAGGVVQSGVGAYRLASGLRRRDRERVVNGGLDLGAGLCWAAASCTLSPAAGVGFAAFTVGKLAYNRRHRIKARVKRVRARVRTRLRQPRAARLPGQGGLSYHGRRRR